MSSYYDSFPWYVRAENENQHLQGHDYSDWTPDEIDYAFSLEPDLKKLEIRNFTQECLEYFVEHYGEGYECLFFNFATKIKDFSSLSKLSNLKNLSIDWYRGEKLWDMSQNTQLKNIWINTAKKLTKTLGCINTCKSLENIMICGDMDTPYHLNSLSCFANMPNLKRIDLIDIRIDNHDISFLESTPNLKEFHFDAGMLTTEEIAYICARYPNLCGYTLGAFTSYAALTDVRVCGYRKPGLNLPEQQATLDRYIEKFNTLVAEYKKQLL